MARPKLSADVVLRGALELADDIGVHDLTIRRLAEALGTKPMTIYHHVSGKDAIIDGVVDLVYAEIELPDPALAWRPAMRRRCVSARDVLVRHPWAAPLMDSRGSPGGATLIHIDAVLGCLRSALSIEATAHAYAALDAFVFGFALQESSLPATDEHGLAEVADAMADALDPSLFPNLVEFTVQHVLQPGYDFGDEFAFGLDLILDGIERSVA